MKRLFYQRIIPKGAAFRHRCQQPDPQEEPGICRRDEDLPGARSAAASRACASWPASSPATTCPTRNCTPARWTDRLLRATATLPGTGRREARTVSMARKRATERVMLKTEAAWGPVPPPEHVPERTGRAVRAHFQVHVPVVQLGAQPVAIGPAGYADGPGGGRFRRPLRRGEGG